MTIHNKHLRNNKSQKVCLTDKVPYANYGLVISLLILIAVIFWSYRSVIRGLYGEWQVSPDSSVGMLVPVIALFLLWYDRKKILKCRLKPSWILGIILLMLSQVLKIWSLLFFYLSGVRYSLIITIAGAVLLIAGREVFKTVFWILLILLFMVPSPTRIQNMIGAPLQNFASFGTVFVLEAFGTEVLREGNVLMLNDNVPMAVAEACNGLRLLTAFIIVTATLTYLMKCSRPRKVILLLSSIPIAIVCNIIRLCLTAAFMLLISVKLGEKFFHDFAGLTMMPIAVLLLFAELWFMDKIIPSDNVDKKCVKKVDSGSSIEIHARHLKKKNENPVIVRNK